MIRRAVPQDIDFIYDLYMHTQVNPWLLYEPMDKESFRPIFMDLLEKQVKYVFMDKQQPVGMLKLIPLTYRTDHIVYLGGLAVDPSMAGKGYGQQLLQEALEFAKQQGFKRIELSVAVINEKAIRLYERNGFEKEGVLKKYTHLKKENRFLDEVLMAYLVSGE